MTKSFFPLRLAAWLLIAGFSPCLLIGAPAAAGVPDPSQTAPPSQAPVEERLSYDIAFLWFDRLAEARLSLVPGPDPGIWQSELEARTLGVAAWLTSERVQRYGSKMDVDGEGRLRSLRHDADIIKTKGGKRHSRLKSFLFDYDLRQIVLQVNRNGRVKPEEVLPMPAANPNDILTAFYNFRAGAFGEIRAGGHYRIPTLGKGETAHIVVDIFAEDKRPRDKRFPKGGLLAKVKLDPEVFDTGEGILYIWFDEQRRPALVLVENVIGMGDVRCTLKEGAKKP